MNNTYRIEIVQGKSATNLPPLPFAGCLPFTPARFLATLLISASSILSAFLLYELYYVVNQICLPCIGIYFLHLLLFVVLTMRWGGANSPDKREARPSTKPSRRDPGEMPKEKEHSDEGDKKQKGKKNTQPKKRNR